MKKTQIERAIESIDANIQVLQLARQKLVEQQQAKAEDAAQAEGAASFGARRRGGASRDAER